MNLKKHLNVLVKFEFKKSVMLKLFNKILNFKINLNKTFECVSGIWIWKIP